MLAIRSDNDYSIYDAWNRLAEVKDGTTTVAQYEYDGLNRRIVKTVGADTFHYYYNMEWQTLEVRKDGFTSPVEQYVWHPYYIDAIAVRYQDANTNGNFSDTNEVQYYGHDANYNATGLIDASGNLIERYTYTGYGHLIVMNPSFTAIPSSVTNNPYTFTGRRLDSETGLYYYRNRFYHAQLGRFISRDPIEYAGGPNLYEFVGSAPTASVDPLGLIGEENFWYSRYPETPQRDYDTSTSDPCRHGADQGLVVVPPVGVKVPRLGQFVRGIGVQARQLVRVPLGAVAAFCQVAFRAQKMGDAQIDPWGPLRVDPDIDQKDQDQIYQACCAWQNNDGTITIEKDVECRDRIESVFTCCTRHQRLLEPPPGGGRWWGLPRRTHRGPCK